MRVKYIAQGNNKSVLVKFMKCLMYLQREFRTLLALVKSVSVCPGL